MQSKYWEIDEFTSTDELHLRGDLYFVGISRDGSCVLVTNFNEPYEPAGPADTAYIDDMTVFLEMMQEAHELARQHFGEQWGKRDE